MSPWVGSWLWDRARKLDDNLVDVGDAPEGRTYDFRGGPAETQSRVLDYLTETRVALLAAGVDLFNLVGFEAKDVALIQAAFRQDVTA